MSLRPFGEVLARSGYRLTVSFCLLAASALAYRQHHGAPPAGPRNRAPLPAALAPQPPATPRPAKPPEPAKPQVPEPPPPAASQADPAPVPASRPKKRAAVRAASLYRDGVFTGNPVDIEYGLVQVAAVIRDGQIADIKWLQDPEDIDLSRQINHDAMPRLTREAITAQKSEVDMITGATFTVLGFRLSLSTALAQAAPSGP